VNFLDEDGRLGGGFGLAFRLALVALLGLGGQVGNGEAGPHDQQAGGEHQPLTPTATLHTGSLKLFTSLDKGRDRSSKFRFNLKMDREGLSNVPRGGSSRYGDDPSRPLVPAVAKRDRLPDGTRAKSNFWMQHRLWHEILSPWTFRPSWSTSARRPPT